MALEIKLTQKLTQSLVMTPQLQQAIKLLQLGRLDYLEVIERELLENPVLEDIREGLDSIVRDATKIAEERNELAASKLEYSDIPGHDDADLAMHVNDKWEDDDFQLSPYVGTGDIQFESSRKSRLDSEENSLEATVSLPEGLVSHLRWQLRAVELTPEQRLVMDHLLGNLDRNGYLDCSLEEISEASGVSLEVVEETLFELHRLEPIGVGARDLKECLLLQLDDAGMQDSLAWRLVALHLSNLEIRKYEEIAKQEGVETSQVMKALEWIKRLEPRPGRSYADETPAYITPDVYVIKVGDEYHISLNESGMPTLRINEQYQRMLRSGGLDKNGGRDFIQNCMRSANWLMRVMEQRQATIYKVTCSIMKYQRDFLEKGVSALKPLVLREIAQDVGVHESTISRVTTNKYVHTPQGLYELKFFFSSGLKSDSGEVSSESVKRKIKDLIDKEDKRKPLSDQAIANKFKADGVDIARRTVAKYRELLGLLSSARRKQ